MENKEKTSGKSKDIIITFLIIIILCLVGYIIYTDFINTDKSVTENQNDNNQIVEERPISQVTQNELKTILGVIPGESEISLHGFYDIILRGNGIVNEMPAISKATLITEYGIKNQKYTKVYGEEYEKCAAGAGFCFGFSEENYKAIATKYGITDPIEDVFANTGYQPYNNMYVGVPTGTTISGTIKHNLTYTYIEDDIKVVDNYTFTDNDGSVDNKTKIYIFKSNGTNYYLYSIK